MEYTDFLWFFDQGGIDPFQLFDWNNWEYVSTTFRRFASSSSEMPAGRDKQPCQSCCTQVMLILVFIYLELWYFAATFSHKWLVCFTY